MRHVNFWNFWVEIVRVGGIFPMLEAADANFQARLAQQGRASGIVFTWENLNKGTQV